MVKKQENLKHKNALISLSLAIGATYYKPLTKLHCLKRCPAEQRLANQPG